MNHDFTFANVRGLIAHGKLESRCKAFLFLGPTLTIKYSRSARRISEHEDNWSFGTAARR